MQILLECASRKRTQGIKTIFGVASEDESEAVKSFTEIAQALALAGATSSKAIIRIGFWFCGGCNRSVRKSRPSICRA